MTRHILLTICLLTVALHAHADPVDVEAARQKAAAFLQGQMAKGARRRAPSARQLTIAAAGPADSYYIFNAKDGQGYVVVSGEDATEDILGYSNTGTIDTTSMPCGMRMLLDNYAQQISHLRSSNGLPNENDAQSQMKAYSLNKPLALYGQGKPYNWLCPRGGIISGWERCPTGCMATAMAQLLYYHQWPNTITNEIPAYTTTTEGYEIEAVPANTPIDWQNIKGSYSGDYETEEGNAIAHLMIACGASVHMDYNPGVLFIGGSSSEAYGPTVTYALQQYFAYRTSATYERSMYYSYDEWIALLRHELEANGPIIYRGTNDNGEGHFFLLEGYDDDGYFDVNWGWDGADNGKFSLIVINNEPSKRLPYYIGQDAVVNVSPKASAQSTVIPLRLWSGKVTPSGMDVYSRSSETGGFDNVGVSLEMYNYIPKDAVFDYAIAYRKYGGEDDGKSFCLETDVNLPVTKPVIGTKSFSMEPPSDGKYKIWALSRESGSTIWTDNDNSTHEYFDACVCGDEMSIKQTTYDNTNFTAIDIEQAETLLRVGTEATFNCHVFNSGTSPKYYDGGMLVNVVWTDENGVEQDKVVYIDRLTFTGNGVTDYTFKFIPFVQGEQTIKILNKRWEVVGSKTINVSYSSTSFDMLEVTEMTLGDGDMERGLIDGTTLRGTLYIKNNDIVQKKDDIIIGLEDVESPQANRTKHIAVTIAPNTTVGYNFSFSNLTAGHHYVITASYTSGEEFYRSQELLCATDGMDEVEPGNEALVAFEYWFDDDYANRKKASMSGNKAVVRASINTDHLQNGLHFLHFRVQSNNNKYDWSGVSTSPFLKLGMRGTEARLDYWIDDDYATRVSLPLDENEDEHLLTFDLSDCEVGLHQICFQVTLPGSLPSAVQRAAVMKMPMGITPQLEYWFDNDIAHSQTFDGRTAASGDGYIYVNTLNMSNLSVGPHRLNFRTIDSDGLKRSAVMSVNVMKLPIGKGTGLEYWYDDDEAHSVTLDGVSEDDCLVYESQLNMSSLSVGLHRLTFRAISKDGQLKSAPVTCYVMKNVTGSISQLEYWFDYDRNNVHTLSGNEAVLGNKGAIFKGELDISGLRPGHHRLHYRGIGSDGQLSTATSSASILVKIDSHGDAVMASYSISVDGDNFITQGLLDAKAEVDFSYVLNAKDLGKGIHTLQTTFWNSYGMSVSETTSFEVTYGDDDAINTPQADEDEDGPIYNLSGMRVNSNAKGILIKNGKKYLVK